ncbi:MAG TPA: hypothetical protein VLK23_16845 [Thermodesulfobacteriota bacterium]|nr:hypothetical protein [Thermodesulfobacteriota bacterium]
MKRIFHKAKNFDEAEEWSILQEVQMTPEERQEAAEEIVKRVYGTQRTDVREAHEKE